MTHLTVEINAFSTAEWRRMISWSWRTTKRNVQSQTVSWEVMTYLCLDDRGTDRYASRDRFRISMTWHRNFWWFISPTLSSLLTCAVWWMCRTSWRATWFWRTCERSPRVPFRSRKRIVSRPTLFWRLVSESWIRHSETSDKSWW